MENRRKFLKKAGIISAAIALNPLKAEEFLPNDFGAIRKPIVLSTWKFGIEANAEALENFRKRRKSN